MFNLTYNDGNLTPDGQHLVPDHATAMNQPSCSFSFVTSTISNSANLSTSLSEDASVEGKGWGASFSASVGYKNVHETTSHSESRFYSTKAQCMVYSASINYNTAMLSNDFVNSVSNLSFVNSTSNETISQYLNFINQYGTHFVYSMRMGGRYGYRSEVSNSKSMELTSQGLNVKVAAGYSGLKTVSANAVTDDQEKQAQEFEEARSSVQEFFVGGGPPIGSGNWTAKSWAATVEKNPLPITYTIVHIENLLTSDYFPRDTNIAAKKAILLDTLKLYCFKISAEPDLCYQEYRNSTLIPLRLLKEAEVQHSNNNLWLPILKPLEKVPGMVVSQNFPSTLFVILSNDNTDISSLVRPAGNWTSPGSCSSKGVSFHSPSCPKGFSSVSDFYSIPNSEFDPAKNTLPCFADACITDCSFFPTNPAFIGNDKNCLVYVHQKGYPALGGQYGIEHNIHSTTTVTLVLPSASCTIAWTIRFAERKSMCMDCRYYVCSY